MSEQKTKGGEVNRDENSDTSAISSSSDVEIKSITSYDIFEKCIIRAENLISVHSSTEKNEEISEQHYCDCFRAAVVLSISALDAFIRKIVITEIRKILSDDTKPINKELSEYIKNLLNQNKLLDAARKYNLLDKVEAAVKDDFSTKSFQGEWKINSYLNMVGYKDIFSAVSVKADINEKNLVRKLTLFTNRRHVIAHSGDYDLNQTPHKEHDINKPYADECIKIVRLFAVTIHEIMEEK
ncbi:MAG: HEPN domain-containing protein [Pseudomonadota bacterium]